MFNAVGQSLFVLITYVVSAIVLLLFFGGTSVESKKKMFLIALSFIPYINFVAFIIIGLSLFINVNFDKIGLNK